MRGRVPEGAIRTGFWIHHDWIKGADVVLDFLPPLLNLITEPQIQSQIRAYFKVVLNEHLRVLGAWSIFWCD